MKDKICIAEGIMEQIKKPLYYSNFTFDDILEWAQSTDDLLCEDFGVQKVKEWNNKQCYK